MSTRHFHTLALLGAVLAGCPGTLDPSLFLMDATADSAPLCPSTSSVEGQIFNARCGTSGCHDSAMAAGHGLDLASPGIASRLSGMTSDCMNLEFIAPGDPNHSLLYMMTTTSPPCGGVQMPVLGPYLSSSDTSELATWINCINTVDAGTASAPDSSMP